MVDTKLPEWSKDGKIWVTTYEVNGKDEYKILATLAVRKKKLLENDEKVVEIGLDCFTPESKGLAMDLKMLAAAIDFGAEKKFDSLQISLSKSQKSDIEILEKLGFKVIDTRPVGGSNWFHSIINMFCELEDCTMALKLK